MLFFAKLISMPLWKFKLHACRVSSESRATRVFRQLSFRPLLEAEEKAVLFFLVLPE